MNTLVESINVGQLHVRQNKKNAATFRLKRIKLSPTWNRPFIEWKPNEKTLLIETVLIGRSMNPAWTVLNPEENCHEVLDGQHRLKIVLMFYNNEFKLSGKYSSYIQEKGYDGFIYDDMNSEDQESFQKYCFSFNHLSQEYWEDEEKRIEMYRMLNKNVKPANDFEMNNVIYHDINVIFGDYKSDLNSKLFKKKDSRGAIESEIWTILALSETDSKWASHQKVWASLPKLVENYQQDVVGKTKKETDEYLKINTDAIRNKLKCFVKFIDYLDSKNFFKTNGQEGHVASSAGNYVPYKCIISRLAYKFNFKTSVFYRQIDDLIPELNKQILDVVGLERILGCESRNAKYQRALVKKIDEIIDDNWDPSLPSNRRKFTKADIERKRIEQNYICNHCKRDLKNIKYEGDHIHDWAKGGKTEYSNLQILCTPCHKQKTRS